MKYEIASIEVCESTERNQRLENLLLCSFMYWMNALRTIQKKANLSTSIVAPLARMRFSCTRIAADQ